MKTVLSLQINELMYNPDGDDNNKEFIEIYDENNVSLSNWVLFDLNSNDTLEEKRFCNCSYSLIVEENFDYSNISNCSIYSTGATIGDNLDNTEDKISLFKPVDIGGEIIFVLIDEIFYNSSIGANGNGYSLELFNNSLRESLVVGGTPALSNSWTSQSSPTNFNETNSTEINTTQTNQTDCNFNVSIQILTESQIDNGVETYFNDEKLNYKINVEGIEEFEMTYWVEDFNGDILKSKVVSTNDNSRSWTINIDKEYSIALIKAEVNPVCSENKTESSKMFVIKNKGWVAEGEEIEEEQEEIYESEIELVKYEIKIKENEPFLVEFIARKGDTGKTKLDFWFDEDNKYSVYLYDKNSEQKFKIPMVIGCFNESNLSLHFEGVEINQSFKLNNVEIDCLVKEECEICENCEEGKECEEDEESDYSKECNCNDFVFPLNQTLNQTFESSSSKAREFVPYILGASSIIALIGALVI